MNLFLAYHSASAVFLNFVPFKDLHLTTLKTSEQSKVERVDQELNDQEDGKKRS